MRVKYTSKIDGPGPSEAVVSIPTAQGSIEEIIVHTSLIENGTVELARIGQRGDSVLVELPQESVVGKWRIWVPAESIARGSS